MPIKKPATRDIIVAVGLLVVFAVAILLVLNVYKNEGEKRSAAISDAGEKDPNHIEVYVKLLSVDPTKGDVSARLEFIPKGSLAKEDGGPLTRPIKLYVNSATGKQEHDFPKDKRMNPVDITISLYDGLVTDYPFDKHKGFLELYFSPAGSSSAEKPGAGSGSSDSSKASTPPATSAEGTPATTPTPAASPAPAAATGKEAASAASSNKDSEGAPSDDDVSIAVDFFGSIPGMKIEAEKTKDSDDDYVGIDMTISRSSTVLFFSLFIAVLMWGATLGVLLLVLSIILRGRKIEVGMFSFLSALLFAMVAVRNSQPGVPPIGTFSDFISFFWAEVILALCLMTILFTWLLRPTAK
ncbi:MAG TPA: DUF4436 family protein [Pyrinomonadaceae bacterium]